MRFTRLTLILPFLAVGVALAQGPRIVGIPSESFDSVAAAQEAHEWCWAAATQMILRWFDIDVDQVDVVNRVKGKITDQPGSERDITAALNGIAKLRFGNPAVVHSISTKGAPKPAVILSELSHHNPMLLAIDTGPRTGHTVVLTAARYYETRSGPQIVSLIMRDPYPSSSNIQTRGRVEISGRALENFLPMIRRSWIIWVTPQKSTTLAQSHQAKHAHSGVDAERQ